MRAMLACWFGAVGLAVVTACSTANQAAPPSGDEQPSPALDAGPDGPGTPDEIVGPDYDVGPDPCGCPAFTRCIDGICKDVPTAHIMLGLETKRAAGSMIPRQETAPFGTAVCAYRLGKEEAMSPPLTELADGGNCRVYSIDHGQDAGVPTKLLETFLGDMGTVTVESTENGITTFTPRESGEGCLKMDRNQTTGLPFAGGEALSIKATGGAVFPAFWVTLGAPLPLVLEAEKPKQGEPMELSWSGKGPGQVHITVSTFGPSEERQVDCFVDDTGSFTLGQPYTAQLLADPSYTKVRAAREVERVIRPRGKELSVRVLLTTSDVR